MKLLELAVCSSVHVFSWYLVVIYGQTKFLSGSSYKNSFLCGKNYIVPHLKLKLFGDWCSKSIRYHKCLDM